MTYTKLPLEKLFSKIEELQPQFIERLRKAVEIPSVSGDELLRPKVFEMSHFLVDELTALQFHDIQVKQLGSQPDAQDVPDLQLPPVVLGRYGSDPEKKNVLVYGHYDVQPALVEDGWATDPFKMHYDEKRGILFGRGTSDDKGPVLGWLNVIQAHRELNLDLPVNLVVCFEGMEESGSIGLDALVAQEAKSYFANIDQVTISDNYWLGTRKPVLTYGLRGCNYYQIAIQGPGADLHSGVFGGIVAEPMTDLIKVMSTLVESDGTILIPGISEMVAKVTPEEDKLYDAIDFSVEELNAASGLETALFQAKQDILKHRWRFPSLSLHGIEGAFSGVGAKTVIPSKVVGKFSIRTVPDIDLDKLNELVIAYVNERFAELKSPNKLTASLIHDGMYWVTDPFNAAFKAALYATQDVWGIVPDYTREGGLIPITLTFERELGVGVMLLPMGRGDDGAHLINEKLDVSNYINGCKTLAGFLHYYSKA